MGTKQTINRTVISAAVAAALGLSVQPAQSVEIDFSGQVNRAITFADNGSSTDTLFVDNNNSGTRVRLRGSGDVFGNMKAGVRWETQYQDNSSSAIDIDDADNTSAFTSRYRELWFSGDWGKVYLGQGDGAANGTSEMDLSGTFIADYSGNNLDDGLSFADSTGVKLVKNSAAFSNFDGLSRNDRVRYDTPKFGPVTLSADAGQDKYEFAGKYGGEYGGTKIVGSVGYVTRESGLDQVGGSVSVLLANGLNGTVHYGFRDLNTVGTREDPQGIYVKLGYLFGNGHKLSVSWNQVDDLAQDRDEAMRIGAQYLYEIKEPKVEIYGMVQHAELDRPGTPLEDVDQISIGSRIKF